MSSQSRTRCVALSSLACGYFLFAGCSQQGGDTQTAAVSEEQEHAEEGHNLHGYWCVEHGVPEEICAQCDTKLAAEYQAKGDWCDEHSRPDSQCFIHHPELEEKFIAQYVAKFGEKPPAHE